MNTFIWRTYLLITELETKTRTYLTILHQKFIEQFPEMTVSKQRVGDQRRAILRCKLLDTQTLTRIQAEVADILNSSTEYAGQQAQENTTNTRMRWNDEINETIMRIYYKITQMETNTTGYRKLLHTQFIEQFPQLAHISEQRVADQRRVIVNNKLITHAKLDEIRKEVETDLTLNGNIEPQQSYNNTTENHTLESDELNINNTTTTENETITQHLNASSHDNEELSESNQEPGPRTNRFKDEQLNTKITITFKTALNTYTNTDPTKRPHIPKQKVTKKLRYIVDYINTELIPTHLTSEDDFMTTQTVIYCAAYAAVVNNGAKVYQNDGNNNLPKKNRMPFWQKRLTNKIADFRKYIGQMTEFIGGNRSWRLSARVSRIRQTFSTHSRHEEPNNNDQQILDTLKQKLNAAVSRLKRYNNCTLRKKQNTLFTNNEKQFYGQITLATQNTSTTTDNNTTPTQEELKQFWSGIWANAVQHNSNAEWIKLESDENGCLPQMEFDSISIETLLKVINKTHNWKAPGTDNIQNYWYKKFTNTHPSLLKHINDFIRNPDSMPPYITQGLTYMIPKSAEHHDPSKYRPITCLQTIYKILTSCLTEIIYGHVVDHNILAEEQKGCRRSSQGCKEQLIIDSVAMKFALKNKSDISTMYIDYRKAYDSVPHSWLLFVLQMYKIHPTIISFLENCMSTWSTNLKLKTNTTQFITSSIPIKRGIFQGDALSPLWFCLALNPLSNMLNKTSLGVDMTLQQDSNANTPEDTTFKTLTHLMYMDDIKLYSKNTHSLHQITQTFSNDIGMEFGIDKCKTVTIIRGKIEEKEYILENGNKIEALDANISDPEKAFMWKQKSIHGRHYHDLHQLQVDKAASNAWLQRGEMFPETEAFMIAIQDQVIDTKNYQKYIMKKPNITDTCRRCHSSPEHIQHITGA
ncbi:uncharacterized protein LOC114354934, partial [Ostrinia furnacalis]|uniref:uncharacterized protein LOC114354934 n=1 Tax=Ostrinia furnacalis TaxID=93504 RepID=UPI00103AF727